MIELNSYKDKVVGVYGLGASGMSTIAALKHVGAHVFFFDDSQAMRARAAKDGFMCTPPKEWPWSEMVALIPGMDEVVDFPVTHPVLRKSAKEAIPVYTDADLFVRELAPHERPIIVGITGVNGKTYTAGLISHILKESGRNVHCITGRGLQILSIDEYTPDDIIVMEMMPTKLRFTTALRCEIGVLLNANNIDNRVFSSETALMKACTRIFRNQNSDDVAIIGVDDALAQKTCTAMMVRASRMPDVTGRVIPISGEATLGEGFFVLNGRAFSAKSGKTTTIADFSKAPAILGEHIHQNAAAAVATCLQLGVSSAHINLALQSFTGIEGRFQYLGDRDRVMCFDDCKANNVAATEKALTAATDIFWIGGGADIQDDYDRLGVNLLNLQKAFLFGDAAGPLSAALNQGCESDLFKTQMEAIQAALLEARRYAYKNETASPIILYSPACPVREKGGTALYRNIIQKFLREVAA